MHIEPDPLTHAKPACVAGAAIAVWGAACFARQPKLKTGIA